MQVAGGVSYRVSHGDVVEPRLAKAAHEFEAQMMKELIRPIMQLDEHDDTSGSEGALTDFGSEVLGQSLSRAGGFGIAEWLITELSRNKTSHRSNSVSEKSKVVTANYSS